ncbi:hypothetical protein T12_5129 [Trichinella patagoniensis]|uniref:Uncharacterized protein n=1 Tax=Trichinella patagoniensis TaxID=990121 RepID=A0A0V0ZYG7_9BILA|nr:hypothetical protein T12_16999 [Trichinella patagoniensis]KRY17162.1 hypothetical protein T12_5129 [Trichinella patagoniensis]
MCELQICDFGMDSQELIYMLRSPLVAQFIAMSAIQISITEAIEYSIYLKMYVKPGTDSLHTFEHCCV